MTAMTPLQACMRVAATLRQEDLIELNRHTVQLLRQRQAAEQLAAAQKFIAGDLVEFIHSKTGEKIRMRVEKFNRKSISGEEITPLPKRKWRVAPTFCRLVGS